MKVTPNVQGVEGPRERATTAPETPAAKAPRNEGWLPSLGDAAKKLATGFEKDVKNAVAKGVAELGLTAYAEPGPAPTLKRPVVMVPGFTMHASSYDPMAQHLASNAKNGKVAVYDCKDGTFHEGSSNGPAMSKADLAQAKIFQIEYRDPKGPPTEKAPEIQSAMRAISAATGSNTVDVVAHSGGCTDFRLYLQDRGAQDQKIHIGQAVLVGPASHGTAMGNIGDAIGAPMGLDRGGRELEIGSPLVHSLNQTWSQQRNQMQGVTIVGITGAPTPGANGITDGDGFMQVKDLGMPDAKTVLLRGADPTAIAHLKEIGYGGVIGVVDRALGSG